MNYKKYITSVSFLAVVLLLVVHLTHVGFCDEFKSNGSGTVQFTGSWVSVNPSLLGAEFEGAYLFSPIEDHGFWIGPRFGVQFGGFSPLKRLDFHGGIEGVLWFVNAIGVGLGTDVVAPSFNYPGESLGVFTYPVHFRIDPFLALRIFRFDNDGAWAFRIGFPYDTLFQWGIQLGVSLQIGGIPKIGESFED